MPNQKISSKAPGCQKSLLEMSKWHGFFRFFLLKISFCSCSLYNNVCYHAEIAVYNYMAYVINGFKTPFCVVFILNFLCFIWLWNHQFFYMIVLEIIIAKNVWKLECYLRSDYNLIIVQCIRSRIALLKLLWYL